jgi:hypothetical protein
MRSFWVPDAICARSLLVVRHYRMYVRIGISVMLMQRLYSAVELPSISSFAGPATCRSWRVNSSASAHFAVGPRAGMFWIRGLPNDITTTTAVQKLAEPSMPFSCPLVPDVVLVGWQRGALGRNLLRSPFDFPHRRQPRSFGHRFRGGP